MIKDLQINRTAGGSIYNAYLLSYIALTPLTGYLTDRLGARRVIAVCAFVLGAGIFLMGTVRSLWTACLFYAVAGLGATGMWTPVITVVQRWFAPNRRGLALGILSTGYGLGFATMGAVFPWIVGHLDWRYAWFFLGAGALAMVGANGVLLRSDPESAGWAPWGQDPAPEPPRKEAGHHWTGRDSLLKTVLGNRTFWLIGLSYFSVTYSLYGITTFMVDYAKYQLGLPLDKASLLATVHGTCQIIGVLTVLPLSDFLGRRKTILISNCVITASLIGIYYSGNSWIMLYGFVGILAVFYGVTFPIYGACAGEYFPKEVMGTVIGAWTPFYGLGAVLVHWVCGALRDRTGTYDDAFALNIFMAGLGVLLMWAVRKRSGTAGTVQENSHS
jgi:sugar phosphate permease